MNSQVLLTFFVLALVHQVCQGASWHYHGPLGPDKWHMINGSQCGGRRQSPINIMAAETVPADLGDFIFVDLKQHSAGGGGAAGGGGRGAGGGGGRGPVGGGQGAGGAPGAGGGHAGHGGHGGNGWHPRWGANGGGGGGAGAGAGGGAGAGAGGAGGAGGGGGGNANPGFNQGWGNGRPTWQQGWNQFSPGAAQWSNPFGNLQMAPAAVNKPFGSNNHGQYDTLGYSDNGVGPDPHSLIANGVHHPDTRRVEVSNNGHTLKVGLEGFYTLRGGSLPAEYKPAQLHFHWGSQIGRGSEHLVNNNAFAAELHLVHYHSQYTGIGEAIKHENGLAVLGFFIEEAGLDNQAFEPLLHGIETVSHKGTKIEYYARLPLVDMFPRDMSSYWRYNGSLTVPMCDETVLWTVFKQHILMSKNQLDKFRDLYQGFLLDPRNALNPRKIEDNFRPPQPLFGRQILESGNGRVNGRGQYIAGTGFSKSGPTAGTSRLSVPTTTIVFLLSAAFAAVCRSF